MIWIEIYILAGLSLVGVYMAIEKPKVTVADLLMVPVGAVLWPVWAILWAMIRLGDVVIWTRKR